MASKSDSPTKTCTKDGCERALRARGLCGSHYNQAHHPNRHAKKLTACAWCGTEVLKQAGGNKARRPVCSDQCRQWLKTPYCALPTDHWARWYGKASTWAAPKRQMVLLTIDCEWCGKSITQNMDTQRWCSRTCKTRGNNRKRRARERGALGQYSNAQVIDLWLALGMCCAYCDEPTMSVTADHIVSLARGGSNDITNIAPACSPCNSDKRELTLDEWQHDRIRRGLKPLYLTEPVATPAAA
jgi:predicted nucleic acid-binding Zn ribbon protein